MIQFYSQQDSGKLCLTLPEFKFYATAVVERNGLQKDTTIMGRQNREQKKVIGMRERQAEAAESLAQVNDSTTKVYKGAFNDLIKKHEKCDRKLAGSKKVSLVFIVTTIILGAVVFLKP